MKFAHTEPKGAAWLSLLLAILFALVALFSSSRAKLLESYDEDISHAAPVRGSIPSLILLRFPVPSNSGAAYPYGVLRTSSSPL